MSRSIQLYNICEKGGKITFYLIFLGIASLLYLPDMVDKYQKKATTFTTVTEQVKKEKVDPPTITICMDMPLKPSYVESTLKDAEYFWRMKRGSMTRGKNTNELFENATYQYNQDFVLRYGEDVTGKSNISRVWCFSTYFSYSETVVGETQLQCQWCYRGNRSYTI